MQVSNANSRNYTLRLGLGALAIASAFAVPGFLGMHRVIQLPRAANYALFGASTLPALLAIAAFTVTCKAQYNISCNGEE